MAAVAGTTEKRERLSVSELVATPWALAGILFATTLVYGPALASWFTGDDFWFIDGARDTSIVDYVLRSLDPSQTDPTNEFNRYRPLYPIVWRLQYAVFGLHPLGYHLVALAVHLASTVLVWQLARRLLRPDWTATAATMIFALHPAPHGAVAWISGNRAFATLPALASLLLFMRFVDGAGGRRLAYLGSLLAYVAAVLMHSSAVGLVVVLPAYRFFVAGEPRDALKPQQWAPFLPFFAVAAGVAVLQAYVRDHLALEAFSIGWHQYSVYAQYLAMLVVPPESAEFSGAGGDLLSLARGAAALLVLGAMLLMLVVRPVQRVALFCAFALIVFLLPDSTFPIFVSGRALHLAAAPFAIFAMCVITWAISAARDSSYDVRVPLLTVGAVVLVLAVSLDVHRSRQIRADAAENERFANALDTLGPELPAGGVLYIENAPPSLYTLAPTWLSSLAHIYYPGADVRLAEPGVRLNPDDRVFVYEP